MTDFWNNVLRPAERERLVDNIASHLCNAQQFIQVSGLIINLDFGLFKPNINFEKLLNSSLYFQDRAVTNFSKVHVDFGSQLKMKLGHYSKQPKKPLSHL